MVDDTRWISVNSPVRVEVFASEATIEIFVEADFETLPEERRRFALIMSPASSSATRQARLHAARQEKSGIGEQRPRSASARLCGRG